MQTFPAKLWYLFRKPNRLYSQLLEKPSIMAPIIFQLLTLLLAIYTAVPKLAQQVQFQLAQNNVTIASVPLQGLLFVTSGVFATVSLLLTLFLSSLLLVGLGRALQIHFSFAFCVSLFAYCQVPIALRNVVNGVYALINQDSLLRLDLGLLWAQESGFVQQVLRQWDPFVLWSYVLLGFGLAAAAPDHRRRGGAVAVAYVVIAMLLNALLSPKGAVSF